MVRGGGESFVNKLKFVLRQEYFVLMHDSLKQFASNLTLISDVLKVQGAIDALPFIGQLLSDELLKFGVLVFKENGVG